MIAAATDMSRIFGPAWSRSRAGTIGNHVRMARQTARRREVLDAKDHMQPALWVTAPFGGAANDDKGVAHTSPTDGMVSVESARWGRFRGCLPADHYHVIGQQRRAGRDPWTGFDVRRFYGWLANDLAGQGL